MSSADAAGSIKLQFLLRRCENTLSRGKGGEHAAPALDRHGRAPLRVSQQSSSRAHMHTRILVAHATIPEPISYEEEQRRNLSRRCLRALAVGA
jgi:hypothetical protein